MTELTEQQRAFFDEMTAAQKEPLDDVLKEWVFDTSFGAPMLKHPLIYMLMPIPGLANRAYKEKQAELDKAIAEEDWAGCVWLHERPWRLNALVEYVVGKDEDDVPYRAIDIDPKWRSLIAAIWQDCENIAQHIPEWDRIMSGHNPGDPLIFCDNEEAWNALPDRIEVWRGDLNDGGWSWSTERSVGEFFTSYAGQTAPLVHGWVDKRNVFGYLHGRNESEVMVRRNYVENIEEVEYVRDK